jgi:hypothetical protein
MRKKITEVKIPCKYLYKLSADHMVKTAGLFVEQEGTQ